MASASIGKCHSVLRYTKMAQAKQNKALTPTQFVIAMLQAAAAVLNTAAAAAGILPPSGSGKLYSVRQWLGSGGQRAAVASAWQAGNRMVIGTGKALTPTSGSVLLSCKAWHGMAGKAVANLAAAAAIGTACKGKYFTSKLTLPKGSLTKATATAYGTALGQAIAPLLAKLPVSSGGFKVAA